jgi:hypothetical protein
MKTFRVVEQPLGAFLMGSHEIQGQRPKDSDATPGQILDFNFFDDYG